MKKFDYPVGSLISFMSNKVKMHGGINLAQGIPGFEPPEELKIILSELAMGQNHQYPPGNGDEELRLQIAQKYSVYNPNLNTDNLIITQGAT